MGSCQLAPVESAGSGCDAAAFEARVQQTIEEHGLFSKESKVLVAASGGKDSTALLQALKNLGYAVEAVTVDARIGCYTEQNLKNLRGFCEKLGIALHEIDFKKEFGMSMCHIRDKLAANGFDYKSCHVCGVLRRYLINKKAKELAPDVLCTGHNLDDEAQVVMMNLLRGNVGFAARLGPKSGLVDQRDKGANAKFVQRVKPLYFTREADVISYAKAVELPVKAGICPCSTDSYRREVRNLFDVIPDQETVKSNIINAFMNVLPRLKEYYRKGTGSINECDICDEPTSRNICNPCSLLKKMDTPVEA